MPRLIHEPLGITDVEAIQRGEQIGQELGIYDNTGMSRPDVAIRTLGGAFLVEGPGPVDLLRIYGENDFTVLLHRNTSDKFDRLATAEAVGHYTLHYLPSVDVRPQAIFRYKEGHRLYKEAYFFALGLLLPEHLIREQFEEDPAPSKVSGSYKVGQTAVEDRLRLMGQMIIA